MFWLSESLVTECISVSNEPCIVRPTFTDCKSCWAQLLSILLMAYLQKYVF